MSIIKNSSREGDYYYKIAKFGTHGEVPYTDADGKILFKDGQGGRQALYANTYCEYDGGNEYFTTNDYIGPKSTLILNVYIPEDVSSMFVVSNETSQGNAVAIAAGNGKVVYFYGDTTTPAEEHNYTPGWHIIGFLPSGNGVRAVYDAQMFGSELTAQQGKTKVKIGNLSSSISGMRISKVCTSEYLTTSSTMRYTHHYYPVTYEQPALEDEAPIANLTCHWYESRVLQGIPTGAVEEGIASGTAAPHGVTIFDLQEATGSQFRDLMAIWTCDDTPESLDTDADAADTLTKTTGGATETRKFAFSIADIDFDDEDEPRIPIPLPEGWTLADRSSADRFEYVNMGELICGRQPKWDMWNDSTKRFTSVIADTDNDGISTNLTIRLNIQCDRFTYSGNGKVKLEDFIGYSSDRSKSYRPKFELLDGGFTSERHNKVECRCDETTLIPNYDTSGATVNDQNHIYTYAEKTIGRAKCAIGNLANWDKTLEELSNLDDRDIPGVLSDGMAVAIYADITVDGTVYHNAVLAIAKCMGDEIFSTEYLEDGMEDALTLFREGKENGEDKILPFELNTQTFGGKTVREILSSQTITNAKAGLMLVNANRNHISPTGEDMIFAHRIIPSKPANIGFNDDPMMVTGSTNYRCILRTPTVQINGTTYHIYPVWTASGGVRQTMLSSTYNNNQIDFNFTLIEDGHQSPTNCKSWSDEYKDMYVKIKLSGVDDGEPYSYTFTKQGTQASQDEGDELKVGLYLHYGNTPTPSITDRTAIQDTVFPNGEKYIYDRSSAENYLWCSHYLLYGSGANLQRYCQHTDNPSSTIVPIPENTTCEIWISPTQFDE